MDGAGWGLAERVWRGLGRPLRRALSDLRTTRFVVGVSVLLQDRHGRVLVLEHRFWGRYRWGLPSGTARRGETPAAAAARELFEETGLRAHVARQIEVACHGRRLEIVLGGSAPEAPLRLQRREVLQARFAGRAELPAGLLPAHRRLIERHFDALE